MRLGTEVMRPGDRLGSGQWAGQATPAVQDPSRIMPQTSIRLDDRTENLLGELKDHYGASSKAEVMRKALALLDTVRRAQEDGDELALVNGDNRVTKFVVL